jgi:ABC-type transporter MlaC component
MELRQATMPRSYRAISAGALLAAALVAPCPAGATASDAQAFIEQQHRHVEQLLHTPPSSSRDTQIHHALASFVDYDDLTRRAFGQPCPESEPQCEDLWAGYNDPQHAELRGLLEQLVQKNYERNLTKTLDYDVSYRGSRDAGGNTRVLTEAKSRLKPREPAVRVDYIVRETPEGYRVVDIITEGSSLTKNYYDQFRKKMHNPSEGYANIVQKLQEKIAK